MMQAVASLVVLLALTLTPPYVAPARTGQSPEVVILRDPLPGFEIFEREFRRAYAGRVVESIVVTDKTASLPRSIQDLAATDVIVSVGRRATALLQSIGTEEAVARRAAVAPRGTPFRANFDWFLPIQASPAERVEQVLRLVPDVRKIGVLVPRGGTSRAITDSLRAVANVAGREVLEIREVGVRAGHAGACISALAGFSKAVEVVVLLPDRRVIPPPGSRLELEFLRVLLRRRIWVAAHDAEQLPSRALLSLEPDFVALASCLARALPRPKARRHVELRSTAHLVRSVPENLARMRAARRR